jgi:hypothetical protein
MVRDDHPQRLGLAVLGGLLTTPTDARSASASASSQKQRTSAHSSSVSAASISRRICASVRRLPPRQRVAVDGVRPTATPLDRARAPRCRPSVVPVVGIPPPITRRPGTEPTRRRRRSDAVRPASPLLGSGPAGASNKRRLTNPVALLTKSPGVSQTRRFGAAISRQSRSDQAAGAASWQAEGSPAGVAQSVRAAES